jgi:outer membrane lipoprotein-sorting protein
VRAERIAESPGFELAPTKTLWVDKTRYLVYQEESASKITMPGANEPINERDTTKFDSVSVDEPISPDVFTFTPPPGATEMDTSKEIERVKGQKKSTPN